MKIPSQIVIGTSTYVQIITRLNLYIAKYGCEAVQQYLDGLPLRTHKREGRYAGAYIEGQICREFNITRHDLYEKSGRKELTDARQIACVLIAKYLDCSRAEISALFNRSRHFAKRLILDFETKLKENSRVDQNLLAKYEHLDTLVSAYMNFNPQK